MEFQVTENGASEKLLSEKIFCLHVNKEKIVLTFKCLYVHF